MSKKIHKFLLISIIGQVLLLLVACVNQGVPAPVVNGWRQSVAHQGYYKVKIGDTLYSIAFRFGLDYRTVASINRLQKPYNIYPGQLLRLSSRRAVSHSIVKAKRIGSSGKTIQHRKKLRVHHRPRAIHHTTRIKRKYAEKPIKRWLWPAKGKVVKYFSDMNKGIDIAGKSNSAVRSSSTGVVVYAGRGLRGYGNLLIVKHNDNYLSAYAHNRMLLVKEGQKVAKGQIIARMGKSGSRRVMLHFEIRYKGKPVNPLVYLKKY